jgi:hypothetical protein
MHCQLCFHEDAISIPFLKKGPQYFLCSHCDLRFLDPEYRLDSVQERKRYLLHQAQSDDSGYQNFVLPICQRAHEVAPPPSRGLDFGAGHTPILAKLLSQQGFEMSFYDPLFWPIKEVLIPTYNFITCCEVIEHAYKPYDLFQTFHARLKPGGTVIIKTDFFEPNIIFENWYYRRDPTHVSFYSERTLRWICEHFKFTNFWKQGRVASLQRE